MFHGRKTFQLADQLIFIRDGFPYHLREHLVIIGLLHIQGNADGAVGKAHRIHLAAFYVFAGQFHRFFQHIPYGTIVLHQALDFRNNILFHTVIPGKHLHPFGHVKLHGGNGKFIENIFQHHVNVFFFQLLAVDSQCRHPVLFRDLLRHTFGILRIGLLTVHQHQERFAQFLQGQNCLFLCLQVISPGNLAETSIRGNHKPDGRMVVHDFVRPDFGSLGKGNFIIKPRRLYHTLHVFLHMPRCPLNHVSHTVNQPDGNRNIPVQHHAGSFIGNKFRLRGGDGFTPCTLGQFILGPGPRMFILHERQHHLLHKSFDKGGFTGTHRSQHSYVYLSPRAVFNVIV